MHLADNLNSTPISNPINFQQETFGPATCFNRLQLVHDLLELLHYIQIDWHGTQVQLQFLVSTVKGSFYRLGGELNWTEWFLSGCIVIFQLHSMQISVVDHQLRVGALFQQNHRTPGYILHCGSEERSSIDVPACVPPLVCSCLLVDRS